MLIFNPWIQNCLSVVVQLVESNSRPGGVQLVSTARTNKTADPMDLVELATTIQKVGLRGEKESTALLL